MNLPHFSAEASLGPTVGIYRGKAACGRSGMVEVSSIHEFLGSSSLNSVFSRRCCCFNPVSKTFTCIRCSFLQGCDCRYGFPKCSDPIFAPVSQF
jgi:hypothetical protein